MKLAHQLRAFEQLLAAYDGIMPLHRFLPIYYRKNKQMGSTDRRWATRYIYSFFRLGKALSALPTYNRLAVADFLCHNEPSLIIEQSLPQLKNLMSHSVEDKIAMIVAIYPNFLLSDVFSFRAALSKEVDANLFYMSFFKQPKLYIRVKDEDLQNVKEKLEASAIPFELLSQNALALANGTKLEGFLEPGTYQVQDLSSQKTGAYFKPEKHDKWWDCCAASGGKSLLLHGIEPNIDLLVSDLRPQVLENLKERFRLAGLKNYRVKELDLLQNNDPILHHYKFDGIIIDAPCTGSGTWGRTPEMLSFFDEDKVGQFATLQKQIVANVSKYLKPGKPFIYITCSAFAQENEQVVDFCINELPLRLESMEVISGYVQFADTMFVARLIAEDH